MAATATTRRTQRKPAAVNDAMTKAIEAMLAELGPLDAERAVLAELARKLAATLDGMRPTVAAKMSGQTAGALLRTLDKLGVERRAGATIVPARGRGTARPTPKAEASSPWTDEFWYPGFEDALWAEQLSGIIIRHARRSGGRLSMPGTSAYAAEPWAPDPWGWVEAQKGPRGRRRLP